MKYLFLIYSLFFSVTVASQDTIKYLGFENDTNAWKGKGLGINTLTGSSSILIGDTLTGDSDSPANQRILSGIRSWQVNNGSDTIILDPALISGYDSVYIKIRFTGTSRNPGQGLDENDSIKIYAVTNSSNFSVLPTVVITSAGNNNGKWGYTADSIIKTSLDTNIIYITPIGILDTLNTSSTVLIALPTLSTSLRLMIILSNTQNMEVWNMDDILLYGKKRIKLALKNNSWQATNRIKHIEITWENDESPFKEINILRSQFGSIFEKISTIKYEGSNEYFESKYLDKNPYQGISYYRLEVIETDGTVKLTDIKKVSLPTQSDMSLYPSHTQDQINIQTHKEFDGSYFVIDISGKVVKQGKISTIGSLMTLSTKQIQSGYYILALRSKSSNGNYPFIKN